MRVCFSTPISLAASVRNSYLVGSISSDRIIKGMRVAMGPLFLNLNVAFKSFSSMSFLILRYVSNSLHDISLWLLIFW